MRKTRTIYIWSLSFSALAIAINNYTIENEVVKCYDIHTDEDGQVDALVSYESEE